MSSTRRTAERRCAMGFGVTVLGAAGFGAAYAADQTQLQGLALGFAFAGLAFGFASWVALLPQGPFVEERESMASPVPEQVGLVEEFESDDVALAHSGLPRRMLTLALACLGAVALFPLRSLLPRGPRPAEALTHTPWQDGVPLVLSDGSRIRPDDLTVGTALTVFPETAPKAGDVPTLLLRVDPQQLQLSPQQAAGTVNGIVAFSKLCTHAGCPVGLYAQTLEVLLCPCHQSKFDVLKGAVPTAGPATRPLPQLPIAVASEGYLVAKGDFADIAGPGFWRRA